MTPQGSSTHESVQEYYGTILTNSKGLKTSACSGSKPPAPILACLKLVPQEVSERFFGCGAPLPLGIDGLRVLDLGSGSGRDAFVCAQLVGEHGSVTGVDMTKELLQIAQQNAQPYCEKLNYGKSNMEFIEGHIEYLDRAGIADDSVDIVISNCVVNLSPDKERVLKEAYRVLADGGEFFFSDLYCTRRLPEHVKENKLLWGEGIAGALYIEDFKRLARSVGFTVPRALNAERVTTTDAELAKEVAHQAGDVTFCSITYRLFKLPGLLESLGEDYGQVATYKGTIAGHEHLYQLDADHNFITRKPTLVSGNTAAMVGEGGTSWLSNHFEVTGNRDTHYGLHRDRLTGR
ncbi:TPA: hypothetical protein ACH3X1_013679 [Trebouxia sp. C0004]